MDMKNTFPYTYDQHLYHTFVYDCRIRYGRRAVRIPLDAHFTCPTRDGTKNIGGCTFCAADGAGEHILCRAESISRQYAEGIGKVSEKYGSEFLPIPYFQAYTNTYGPLSDIQQMLDPFLHIPEIPAIILATRPDCLDDQKISWLASLCRTKDIWIELGLQTGSDHTAELFHRGYDTQTFIDCMQKLKKTDIRTCVHLINGLMTEDKEQMLANARLMNTVGADAVKIHMLCILSGSLLAESYRKNPFPLMSREEYIETVSLQIANLDPRIIVERVTADPAKEMLIAPEWTSDKKKTINGIDIYMRQHELMQGCLYGKEEQK